MKTISVIGLRSYPAEFEGMGGIDFYVQKVVDETPKFKQDFHFILYTRRKYDRVNKSAVLGNNIRKRSLFTINSRIFETLIYASTASVLSVFDGSEVVWYHGIGSAFFALLPYIFGKKIVVTVHGFDWERKKWSQLEKRIFRFLAGVIFRFPFLFTVVSSRLYALLDLQFGVKAVYVPPGLEKEKNRKIVTSTPRSESYLLYLGRIVPEKRIEWLLKAFKEIKGKFPHLRVMIAGAPRNFAEMEYEAKLKKTFRDNRIQWLGYVFGAEKAALLKNCSIFVSPSELEGSSISLMEALSKGIPSLVAEGCVDEVMKNLSNVFLFHTDDFSSFKESLVNLILGKKKVLAEPHQNVRELNWHRTAQKFINLF